MSEGERLMTINEVVERFRVAGIGEDDHSRRSYIRELMTSKPPKLVDRFVLPIGRQRAGKRDRRITMRSVDNFLGDGQGAANSNQSNTGERPQDGRTAISELLARIEILEQERAKERAVRADLRRRASEELNQKDLRIVDMENKARLALIELDTTGEALDEVRGIRQTLENVVIDLNWNDDISDISGEV